MTWLWIQHDQPWLFLLFGQLLESPGQGCLAVHDPSQLKKMNPDN